jgi:hypothetical protein
MQYRTLTSSEIPHFEFSSLNSKKQSAAGLIQPNNKSTQ